MFLDLKEIRERIEKTNDQRVTMALLITNVMVSPRVDIATKSAMVATILEMLDTTMIAEDAELIKVFRSAIDVVNEEAKRYGQYDFITKLNEIRSDVKEQMNRIETGEEILKGLKLDNINLN
jgi:hypothetical protein